MTLEIQFRLHRVGNVDTIICGQCDAPRTIDRHPEYDEYVVDCDCEFFYFLDTVKGTWRFIYRK